MATRKFKRTVEITKTSGSGAKSPKPRSSSKSQATKTVRRVSPATVNLNITVKNQPASEVALAAKKAPPKAILGAVSGPPFISQPPISVPSGSFEKHESKTTHSVIKENAATEPVPEKKQFDWFIAILILLCILAFAFIGYAIYKGSAAQVTPQAVATSVTHSDKSAIAAFMSAPKPPRPTPIVSAPVAPIPVSAPAPQPVPVPAPTPTPTVAAVLPSKVIKEVIVHKDITVRVQLVPTPAPPVQPIAPDMSYYQHYQQQYQPEVPKPTIRIYHEGAMYEHIHVQSSSGQQVDIYKY